MKTKLAIVMLFAVSAPAAAQQTSDEQAVRALWQQFETAFNAGDTARIGSFFTPGADRISGAGAPVRGRAEIKRQYAAMLTRRAADGSTQPLRADITVRFVRPDVALVDATWGGRRAASSVAGRFVMVATKSDGRWLFDAGRAWDWPTAPLVIGESFTIDSKTLGEARRINVYAPTIYLDSANTPLPVLYMPDGGIAEDFLHIAGLLQVSVGNGSMRPFLLVGIENTERRRDMTGPTSNPEDRKFAPRVGGSAAFRTFIRDELMPAIKARYRTTDETAVMGESLAGLFVVETFLLEPQLFDTYIAFDPSLWWNNRALLADAADLLRRRAVSKKAIYLASSSEPELARTTKELADLLKRAAASGIAWHYQPMPDETHATIYHPAALRAVRKLFAPPKSE